MPVKQEEVKKNVPIAPIFQLGKRKDSPASSPSKPLPAAAVKAEEEETRPDLSPHDKMEEEKSDEASPERPQKQARKESKQEEDSLEDDWRDDDMPED